MVKLKSCLLYKVETDFMKTSTKVKSYLTPAVIQKIQIIMIIHITLL